MYGRDRTYTVGGVHRLFRTLGRLLLAPGQLTNTSVDWHTSCSINPFQKLRARTRSVGWPGSARPARNVVERGVCRFTTGAESGMFTDDPVEGGSRSTG